MKVTRLSDAERDAFVNERRLGMLSTLRGDGSPFTIPIWFGWTGAYVEMFAAAGSPKMRRIEADGRATLLVANDVDEMARWVSFEGRVTVAGDGLAVAERLFDRYMPDADSATKDSMLALFAEIEPREIRLRPDRITTYAEVA